MSKSERKGRYDNPLKATLQGLRDLRAGKRSQLELPSGLDLHGKTVLITGASSGLGFAAAERMARAGARVLLALRSGIPEKGEQIKSSTKNPQVVMYPVDLSDLRSIDRLTEQLTQDGVRIDVLVSNAAVVPLASRQTPQGLDEMFVVNYLAGFYLINRLLSRKLIREDHSLPARIIIVSSESHRNPASFEWEKFGEYEPYGIKDTVARYGYTKMLLTTFARELSRRLEQAGRPIVVRSLCPGPVNSNIAREAPGWMQPLLKAVFSLFFRSPEKASDPILYFAAGEAPGGPPFSYLFLLQPREIDERADDPVNGRRLWEASEELVGKSGFPIQ